MSGSNETGCRFMSTADAAIVFGVSVDTIRRLIRDRKIGGAINVGTANRPTYRIPRDAVVAGVHANHVHTGPGHARDLPVVTEFV